MTTNQLKRAVKDLLPGGVIDRIQDFRKRRAKPDPRLAIWEEKFRLRNHGVPAGSIRVRDGMEWAVHPESLDAFKWFCYRSPDMVEEFDLFLREREAFTRLLDLGANHGVFSLAFTSGRPEAQALAVDPSPLAFPILSQNLAANTGGRGRAVQVAAGDAEGVLRMKINWHHLEVVPDQSQGESDRVKIVPVRPMDAVCEEAGFEPDVVKVDVEGFELQAIRGMKNLLKRNRPLMFLEVHPELIRPLGYRPGLIHDELSGLGYRITDLQGSEAIPRGQLDDALHTSWYICRPS